MTNNTPDYNDNLYFEEKKMDCKNCPYTDEYCASGDCERDNDLTEQWKKGELPPRYYYIKDNKNKVEIDEYVQWYKERGQKSGKSFIYYKVMEVLAPVPSYDAYMAFIRAIDNVTDDNAQLKELLKSALSWLDLGWLPDVSQVSAGRYIQFQNLKRKINEVLK